MIISFSRNFIYFKAPKTAGSSVESLLARYCSAGDIISPAKEYENLAPGIIRKGYNHMTPERLRESGFLAGKDFNNFVKISNIRNPWDKMVSSFWWVKTVIRDDYIVLADWENFSTVKADFRLYILSLYVHGDPVQGAWNNSACFHFAPDGKDLCDFFVRFENLTADCESLCKLLNIQYTELPRLNTESRKTNQPYWEYYDEETRNLIAKYHRMEIERFNYRFLPEGP